MTPFSHDNNRCKIYSFVSRFLQVFEQVPVFSIPFLVSKHVSDVMTVGTEV